MTSSYLYFDGDTRVMLIDSIAAWEFDSQKKSLSIKYWEVQSDMKQEDLGGYSDVLISIFARGTEFTPSLQVSLPSTCSYIIDSLCT